MIEFNQIRVLETGHNSGAWNMALDEVLLENLDDIPALRLYGWDPPTVSIGYFQKMEDDVDVEKCKRLRIDVVRRLTGGGAVLHDSELTYSFLTKRYPQNILESYKMICDAVIIGLSKLGFNAKFSPLNDIVVGGKKISGNAQTRKNGTLLQHGTILLDVDLEKMFSVLKVSKEKIKDKMILDPKDRVAGLNKTYAEASLALKNGFSEKFAADLAADILTENEKIRTEKLVKEKYTTAKWNFR
jgi:lipoate-protein ligase A